MPKVLYLFLKKFAVQKQNKYRQVSDQAPG